MDITKFEKFLLNKRKFISDMLLILHDEEAKICFQIELDTTDDIIHHFNVLVKGELSSGLGTNED